MKKIEFNVPFFTGRETEYIADVMQSGKIGGNGKYSRLCQEFFENKYGFRKCLLTNSCTSALEMAAILLDIQPGDEVIAPAFTFVSTVNAFVLRGAKIVFVDSRTNRPGMNEDHIESLITSKTKVIIVMHYAGIACDMDKITSLADKYNLFVVEDAALALDGYFTSKDGVKRPLGSLGHLAAFSFHETKNIISGEGGMLVMNDSRFWDRAEIIVEKGTNRSAFLRGEKDKYEWMDIGSSYSPSEITAAFLFAQLEKLSEIQGKREKIWNRYFEGLLSLEKNGKIKLPVVPIFSFHNSHLFFLICKNPNERKALIAFLRQNGIAAHSHYISLHNSPYYLKKHDGRKLTESDYYSECLLRLPLYPALTNSDQTRIIELLLEFYSN